MHATACTGADWGSDIDDRRSVSATKVMNTGAPEDFKSRYQSTVDLSSAETEYITLILCAQEVLWVRALLKEFGFEQVEATYVWEYN